MAVLTSSEFLLRREQFGGLLFHKPTALMFFLNADGYELCGAYLAAERAKRLDLLASTYDLSLAELANMWTVLSEKISARIADSGNLELSFDEFTSISELPAAERHLVTPVFFSWELSNVCNFDCNYCATDSSAFNKNHQGFSREEAFRVAQELVELEVCQIFLSGGEPFAVKYLGDLVEFLTDANRSVIVATNATLLTKQELRKFRNCVLQVKFDTLDSGRYEAITGIRGSFERFLNGARTLADSSLQYYFQAALTPRDIGSLEGMVDFALKHNAWKIKFVTVIPTARGKFAEWQFSDSEASRLTKELARLSQNYGKVVDFKGVGVTFNSYKLPNPKEHPITDCKATRCYMRLTYNRKFVPCNCAREVTIGPFAVGNMRRIWEGDSIRSLRASSFSCPVRIPKVVPSASYVFNIIQ
ncbi:MAG TPA: radical SAM protein [Candidatus Angelobacter sp.]